MAKITKNIHFSNTYYDVDTSTLVNPIETENFIIVQSVDSQYFNRLNVSKHTQICDIELTYVPHGTLHLKANQITSVISKNQSHICFFNESHTLYSNKSCRFQNIAFNIKRDSPYYALFHEFLGLYAENRIIPKNSNIEKIMNSILMEFTHLENTLSPLYLDSLIAQLTIELYRAPRRAVYTLDGCINDNIPLSVVHYIDQNYTTIVTIEELTDVLNFSYNSIFKKFKAAYGISPKDYLRFKRMEHAAYLLTESGWTIAQISEKFGYISSHNFSRAFFNCTGKYPTEYQKAPFPLPSPFEKKIDD